MRLLKICIWLCAITLNINAQPNQQKDRLVEFEYKLYNSNSIEDMNMILLEKYFFLKNNGSIKEAYTSINRINEQILNDSTKFVYFYEYSIIAYLNNNYTEADLSLQKLFYFYKNDPRLNLVLPLAVLINNENGKWADAKFFLKQYIVSNNLTLNVDSLYKSIEMFKPKKTSTAIKLSTLLPGTGQFYAGERFHGALNAGLILSFLSWGAYNVMNGFYATAVFSGFFVAYTFYQGGIAYSVSATDHYNEERYISFKTKVKNILFP
jgi:hypothetical protein